MAKLAALPGIDRDALYAAAGRISPEVADALPGNLDVLCRTRKELGLGTLITATTRSIRTERWCPSLSEPSALLNAFRKLACFPRTSSEEMIHYAHTGSIVPEQAAAQVLALPIENFPGVFLDPEALLRPAPYVVGRVSYASGIIGWNIPILRTDDAYTIPGTEE